MRETIKWSLPHAPADFGAVANDEAIPRRPDATFICFVPAALGPVTNLSIRGGKVVVETESGIDMIVPNGKANA